MLDKAKLRWTGHVIRMDNKRIPKALLYGRLATGVSRSGNHNTYLNSVKRTLNECDIDCMHVAAFASERVGWREKVGEGINTAEKARIDVLTEKRMRCKAADLACLPT